MFISTSAILDALFLVAPQFYSVDPLVIENYEAFVDLLRCQVNTQILGCNAVMVFAFLLAHYLTVQTNPNLGVTHNMTEGQLTIGFNVNPDMGALLLTPYGRSYVDLVRRTVVGSTVTNLPVVLGGVIQNMPLGCCGGGGWGFGNAGW